MTAFFSARALYLYPIGPSASILGLTGKGGRLQILKMRRHILYRETQNHTSPVSVVLRVAARLTCLQRSFNNVSSTILHPSLQTPASEGVPGAIRGEGLNVSNFTIQLFYPLQCAA